jgi:hypothetical protein
MEQMSQISDCRTKVGVRYLLDLTEVRVGARLAIDSQTYELIRIHEFRRKDGSSAPLYTWKAGCATCGKEFITTSSPAGTLPTRRCREHRKPGFSVRPEGQNQRMLVRWLPFEKTAGTGNHPATGHTSAL